MDRSQIERRIRLTLPDHGSRIWVTAAEDQVLRKLAGHRLGGEVSDRQWRDVVSILQVQAGALDADLMQDAAAHMGLDDLLRRATDEANGLADPPHVDW